VECFTRFSYFPAQPLQRRSQHADLTKELNLVTERSSSAISPFCLATITNAHRMDDFGCDPDSNEHGGVIVLSGLSRRPATDPDRNGFVEAEVRSEISYGAPTGLVTVMDRALDEWPLASNNDSVSVDPVASLYLGHAPTRIVPDIVPAIVRNSDGITNVCCSESPVL
jgi:hypothetical protein